MAAATAGMPQVVLGEDDARRFRQGQVVRTGAAGGTVAVLAAGGELIGIGEEAGLRLRPVTVVG
jgi:hypothetical protein